MELKSSVNKASRLYKMYARRLEKLEIYTFEDFLYHIPFRYEDFSLISKIRNVQAGEILTIKGEVKEIKNEYTKRFKKIQKAQIEDSSGKIEAVWFNQPFLLKTIKEGDSISLSGKIEKYLNKLVIQSPYFEIIENETSETIHTGRLVPIYPETRGVSSKWLRRQIYNTLKTNKDNLSDFLPELLIKKYNFLDLYEALLKIHFPIDYSDVEKAKERLSFDELFIIQLLATKRRNEWNKNAKGSIFKTEEFKNEIEAFIKSLPFELTNAQKKVLLEISLDLKKEKPMNRLLEGDVGSGKTVVSAIAIYIAHLNNFQSVLMAPTEILAMQHFKTLSKFLSPLGIDVEIATGNKKPSKLNSEFSVLVGTHAVLSEKIKYKNLGLVVIDEQQRFGVEQRALIRKKGKNPHFLTMTATPIPRTVALTMYGDLDLSLIDEMPIGRKKVKTWLIPPLKRESAYKWIEKEIKNNKSQGFIICPFIEESESMTSVKAATKEFETLRENVFPKLKLDILHGKMKPRKKEEVLASFKNKKIDILVATPIVEVGIDFPNATIILVEASERFGLSQLHQLRGRVGRGDKQSYCLLFSESKSEKTIKRLSAMQKIYFGAELAELDLRLRGPGQLFGTLQHGIPKLKVASFSNFELIKRTKEEAEKIFTKINNFPLLFAKIQEIGIKKVSPD
ncbi:MAG: ATP-dependent DNA helicase RecG [Candidatus Levyibacteriota bacterium]